MRGTQLGGSGEGHASVLNDQLQTALQAYQMLVSPDRVVHAGHRSLICELSAECFQNGLFLSNLIYSQKLEQSRGEGEVVVTVALFSE